MRELTEDLSKAVDDAAGNILKFLDIIQYSGPSSSSDNTMMKYSTELDNKQLALQKEEIVSLRNIPNFVQYQISTSCGLAISDLQLEICFLMMC